MYFTDEEKIIIEKITKKDRYNLSDFLEDNGLVETKVNLTEDYESFVYFNGYWNSQKDFNENNSIKKEDLLMKCFPNYKSKLDIFVRLWLILEKNNLVNSVEIDVLKTKRNFMHFVKEKENEIDIVLCRNFNYFLDKELMIHQSYLQQFINDGFKTKDEIRIEDEIKARNEALIDAKKSLNWTKAVAIISIVFSAISLLFTVSSYNKETEVKVKNLNEINIQKLEAQINITNQELKDIKTKFEKLQKPSQKPTNK